MNKLIVLLVLLAAILVAGCADNTEQIIDEPEIVEDEVSDLVEAEDNETMDMDTEEHMGATVEVIIENFEFAPEEIRISVGDTITWTNLDTAPHTATDNNDMFDSGTLAEGESFSMTFEEAGTYDYICTIHPYMKGTVIVEA
ncbi:cupredoxin domain-containing protein [Methanococcoides alaskense]|uniref:Amicyanin n=1 Tax=Methanococcoides alaskense TaxID=325778 RepID=A0AA90ZDR7_9EURY|nr:cupredoxin family copper-binding protein [Methanococcoides alaskense]MDA0524286.1 cupredoxin family copper-binding protein [Methanococcoides alaskense]MDR6223763.1 amicyanin [Methanococcoides alaskense]